MLAVAERLLGLNARELRRAAPIFGYLFLTMASSVSSKAARDALFLDRYRAIDLPYADIAIAVIVAVAMSLYIRAGQRTNLRNVLVGSLLFFATTALGFWLLSVEGGRESDGLFVLIYIWVGVFSVLAPAQVWTLANYVLTTREAKRAFGVIGSGAILGWIVGGFATRVSVARFGTESMLILTAVSLVLCAVLVEQIWRNRPGAAGDDDQAGVGGASGLFAAIAMVKESPYLRAIAALVWLSALATTVGAWQFKAIAKAMIPDTDALAMFFGTFNMAAGVASLAFQLLVTGRALKSAGVGVTLFIVPIALTLSSVGVLLWGTLLAVTLLRASDQVLRYSIDKATVELLYLPVPPAQTFSVKSFIDTVVYRFGDATGGLLVLLFAAMVGWTPRQMAGVCLAVCLAWIAAAVVARRQYVKNLQDSIHQHRVDAEKASTAVLDRTASEAITAQLHGETHAIVYALSLFEMAHDRAVHPAVRALLKHKSPEVRRRAIALLSRADDLSVKSQVEAMLRDEDLEVRTEALLYLCEHGEVDPLTQLEAVGDFEDFSVRAAMVSFLARPGRTQNVDAARLILKKMVEEDGNAGKRTRLEAARLLSFLPDVFDRELRELVQDEDVEVARAAIQAVGKVRKRVFVGRVIERLGEPELVSTVIATLSLFGDRVVGTLRDFLVDSETPMDVRREIPGVLQAIGTRGAQAVLTESVLDKDVVLRYHVIAALNKLGQAHPERPVDRKIIESVLAAEILGHYRSYQVMGTLGAAMNDPRNPVTQALRESLEKEAERIFRLLKMLHPEHDLHSAYVGLQSADPMVHDNALEFLDTILSPQVRSALIPLFDREVKNTQRVDMANRVLGSELGGSEEAIEVMSRSQDPWLRSCAAYLIGEQRLMRFAAVLEKWTADPDALLRAAAMDAQLKLKEAAANEAGVGML
jgi:AAA family ATP:ADP antiporter